MVRICEKENTGPLVYITTEMRDGLSSSDKSMYKRSLTHKCVNLAVTDVSNIHMLKEKTGSKTLAIND